MWKWLLALTVMSFYICAAVVLAQDPVWITFPQAKERPIKIYIAAGQSNIEGPGDNEELETLAPELMKPRDDVWCVYAGRPAGPLKPGFGFRPGNFGPELKFGHVMGDSMVNHIIIMKSATGGATLYKDWRPPGAVKRAGGEVGPFYKEMIRRAHSLFAHLDEVYPDYKGQGYEVAGFIWFQGENDSCGMKAGGTGFWNYYKDNLLDLIKDVRHDLGVPNLPVVIAQINDSDPWEHTGGGPVVREAQKYAADNVENVSMIVTMDLDPGYHYDSASHVVIGERLAEAMLPYSKEVVHKGDDSIKEAGRRFLEREFKAGSPDVTSLRDGLIGYWKFDEEGGYETFGSSPNGYLGILRGDPIWIEGLSGSGVMLVKGQSIEIPDFVDPVSEGGKIENLSISLWIQAPQKEGGIFISKWTQSPESGWQVSNFANEGWADFSAVIDGDGRKDARSDWGGPLMSGDGFEWHHVVCIYDGSTNAMSVYVDDVPVPELPKEINGKYITPSEAILTIHGPNWGGDSNFQGYDEIAVWKRALTRQEVTALFNNAHGAEILDEGR